MCNLDQEKENFNTLQIKQFYILTCLCIINMEIIDFLKAGSIERYSNYTINVYSYTLQDC